MRSTGDSIRQAKAVAVVAACLIVFSGCAADAPDQPSTSAAVSDAYRTINDALVAGKTDLACSLVTDQYIEDAQSIAPGLGGCAAIMTESHKYFQTNPRAAKYRASNVSVRGDVGVLTATNWSPDGVVKSKYLFVRKNGKWQLNGQTAIIQGAAQPLLDAYRKYITAVSRGDSKAACSVTTEHAQRILIDSANQSGASVASCENAVKVVAPMAQRAPRSTVINAQRDGDNGVVLAQTKSGDGSKLMRANVMVREHGKWLFNGSDDHPTISASGSQ